MSALRVDYAAEADDREPARKFLVADLLCGAGGSSTGAKLAIQAIGAEMELVALNHWATAIETHLINHPTARHYVQDIAACRPAELVPEGYLDLLMASPTCTHHSRARGAKPTSDQQRADPWHVITWLTELRVYRLFIENVPEFTEWGPVDPHTKRPIKARKGEYFRAWIEAIQRLGFAVEWHIAVCANYGDPTTRKRFFMLARSDGKPVRLPLPSHTRDAAADLFTRGLKKWRVARDCINWSHKSRSIYGRKMPLAPKTIARIYAGINRHGWPEPYIVTLRKHAADRGIDLPLPTISAKGKHFGLVTPVMLPQHFESASRSVDEPVPTVTTISRVGLVEGAEVEPFILSQASGGSARDIDEPIATITTGGNGSAHALITPYYGSGSGESCKSIQEPLDTITTHDRFGIVIPITHHDAANRSHDLGEPLRTITTAHRGEFGLVTPACAADKAQASELPDPFLVNLKGQSSTRPIDQPSPTVTAHAGHLYLTTRGVKYDILFRMLQPDELARATSLDGYRFAGNKTEIIKQIGNAVPAMTAAAHVAAVIAE